MVAASAAPALAGTANGGLSGAPAGNPLAGMKWGVYTGPIDQIYPAYLSAHGRNRRLLARIALRPRAVWFGPWYADSYARTVAQQVIAASTGGDPNALTQMAVFRLDPWEGAACRQTPTAAQQASYRGWIRGFASGIGRSRVALILQPDLPFALCAPTSIPLQLVNYAAKTFARLPHTTVYIDAGAFAWAPVAQAARMLNAAGVRHVRGFALNDTQFGSNDEELTYGGAIARALAALGVHDVHFVLNTIENGAPFLAGQIPGGSANPRVCRSPHDSVCETLGIPPTTRTTDPRWGLSPAARAIAAREADAFLWIGRPWLRNGQSGPFDFNLAVNLAASTPF